VEALELRSGPRHALSQEKGMVCHAQQKTQRRRLSHVMLLLVGLNMETGETAL